MWSSRSSIRSRRPSILFSRPSIRSKRSSILSSRSSILSSLVWTAAKPSLMRSPSALMRSRTVSIVGRVVASSVTSLPPPRISPLATGLTPRAYVRRRRASTPRRLTWALLPDAFEERLELARARGVAELAERLGFNLSDALARDGEVLADLFERVLAAVLAEAEAHLDDLLLARGERGQDLVGYLA